MPCDAVGEYGGQSGPGDAGDLGFFELGGIDQSHTRREAGQLRFRAFENRRRRRVGANEQKRLVQPGQQRRILNPRVSQNVQQPPQRFLLTRAELQTGLFQRFNQLLRCHLVRQCNARAAVPLAFRWSGLFLC
jgi:hypothetical protein